MPPMPITDAMFLLLERRGQPMHVGGLQLFSLPDDDRGFLVDLYQRSVETPPSEVHPLFRRRAHRPLTSLGQWSWDHDNDIDLEYHLRHNALPAPGRVRELLALVSRVHGSLLDRTRPLWEAHLIEGLEGGRFALYTKVHHAVVDGVSAMRLLMDSLTEDPDARDLPLPWAMPVQNRKQRSVTNVLPTPGGALAGLADAVTNLPSAIRAVARTLQEALSDMTSGLPSQAPKTPFNGSVSGARRFAAQSWPLERLRAVGKAAGATLNDVVLAMCAGALRSFLADQDALPDKPLIAMVPVSLRSSDEARSTGNAVGIILCDLATDEPDAARRLERIVASTASGKERMRDLGATQNMAIAALAVLPRALPSLLGDANPVRPPFNLVISNVPGPKAPLYYNGAQMLAMYPVSIALEGQALNITVTSYVDNLEFGLIGCRSRVPHLQRLLGHLDNALEDLTKAAGV